MSFDKKLAFDFLKSVAFERVSGCPEEDQAVKLIRGAARKLGVKTTVETFPIRTLVKGVAELEVLKPYKKTYPAKPTAMTGEFLGDGKVLPLVFAGMTAPSALGDLKGKAVYGYRLFGDNEILETLLTSGAAAILDIMDYGRKLRYRRLLDRQTEKFGRTPILVIPYEAGLEMASRKAAEARVSLKQGERATLGKNVIATIPGTCPELNEEIVICGHYDSVPDSPGAHDNAGGAAIMVALLKRFAKNPTRRALRFIWFGGEEQGLLGSQAYVNAHADEMARVKMVVNIDGVGRVVDINEAMVTGPDGLKTFVDLIARERGVRYPVTEAVLGSDGVSFSWHEIPVINITGGAAGNLFAHTENDDARWCGPEGLAPNGEISLEIVRRLGESKIFPFPRGYNEVSRKSLKNYYEKSLRLSKDETPKWMT